MRTVTIRLFAQLREAKGVDELTLDLQGQQTLAELYAQVFDGPLAELPVAFARNHGVAKGTELAHPGDLIAFLPPVGGG